jgi:hypothetical protein
VKRMTLCQQWSSLQMVDFFFWWGSTQAQVQIENTILVLIIVINSEVEDYHMY